MPGRAQRRRAPFRHLNQHLPPAVRRHASHGLSGRHHIADLRHDGGNHTGRIGLELRVLRLVAGKVELRLEGPDCSTSTILDITSYDRAVTWTSANKINYYGPEKITVTFTATTGLVSGTILDTVNGINQHIGGALLQKQGLVSGSYVSQGKSGRFLMHQR